MAWFAARPEVPSSLQDRAFAIWLREAEDQIREHVKELKRSPSTRSVMAVASSASARPQLQGRALTIWLGESENEIKEYVEELKRFPGWPEERPRDGEDMRERFCSRSSSDTDGLSYYLPRWELGVLVAAVEG